MHISCDKKILIDNINIVMKSVPSKSTSPILGCILLIADRGGFHMLANDLELSIETVNIDNVDVYTLGEVALPSKMFFDTVRGMPDGILDIECNENFVTVIKGGKTEMKMLGFNGSEFPRPEYPENEKNIKIKGEVFKSMIRQTIFSVALVDYRQILMGELLEFKGNRLKMVALDGHRIACRTEYLENNDFSGKTVIPGKALNEVCRLASDDETISFDFNDKFVKFELENSIITSRILEGEFMDYERIFTNDHKTYIKVNREALLEILNLCMLIYTNETKKVEAILEIKEGVLNVSTHNINNEVKKDIPVDHEGEDIKIGFNPKYLADVCKAIDEEEISMYFISSLSPCIIKSSIGNEGFKYLVVPVKIMGA